MANHRRQQKTTAHGRERRFEIEFIFVEQRVIVIDVAERLELRQQGGAAEYAGKCVAEGAGSTPRWQEDRCVGQRERLGTKTLDQAAGEAFGERRAGRDGVDVRCHAQRAAGKSARKASASFTASGVPT